MQSRGIVSDPVPIGTALLAFALPIYGIRFVGVNGSTFAAGPITVGLNYALLVAAIGESVCGLLALTRGASYHGYILGIFGVWLWGFYFLVTTGAASKQGVHDRCAPSARDPGNPHGRSRIRAKEHPLATAFVGLIVLVFFLGLGYHDVYTAINTATATKSPPQFSSAVSLLKGSAWAAWVAAAALFWMFAVEVIRRPACYAPSLRCSKGLAMLWPGGKAHAYAERPFVRVLLGSPQISTLTSEEGRTRLDLTPQAAVIAGLDRRRSCCGG